MATTQNNPYPYKDIPYNGSFWQTVRLSSDITPEQLHQLHLKHGHPTQSQTLGIPSLGGMNNGMPNPNFDLSLSPLTQDKFDISNFTIPEKTRISGMPFQYQQSPEGSYVPITGADLGLAPTMPSAPTTGNPLNPIPGQLPYAPPGVTMDGPPVDMTASSNTPSWIEEAQNPATFTMPPYNAGILGDSGTQFARMISGGQAVPSMGAPGVSYSLENPMGYTQEGASRVPFPSYTPPPQPDQSLTGILGNTPADNYYNFLANNSYLYNDIGNKVIGLGADNRYDTLDFENAAMFALQDRLQNPLENLNLLDTTPIVETRPATISPLGSLDTTFTNDIDFSGLLNIPTPPIPPVDVPVSIPQPPIVETPVVTNTQPPVVTTPQTPVVPTAPIAPIVPPIPVAPYVPPAAPVYPSTPIVPPVIPPVIPPVVPPNTPPPSIPVNTIPDDALYGGDIFVEPPFSTPIINNPIVNDYFNLFDERIGQPLEVTVPLPYTPPYTPPIQISSLLDNIVFDTPAFTANPQINFSTGGQPFRNLSNMGNFDSF